MQASKKRKKMKTIELLKKEFILFKRNKKQIAIVILLPLIFSLIYLVMFKSSGVNISLSICNMDKAEYSNKLINALEYNFDVKILNNSQNCMDELKEDVAKGTMLGVFIEEGFSEKINEYNSPYLHLIHDNTKPNLGWFVETYINKVIDELKNDIISQTEDVIKKNTLELENNLKTTVNMMNILESSVPSILNDGYTQIENDISSYYDKIKEINSIDLNFLVNPIHPVLIGILEGKNDEGYKFVILYVVLNIIVILLLSSISIVYDKKNNFFVRLKTSSTPMILYLISKILFFIMIGILIFIPAFIVFLLNNAYFNVNYLSLIVGLILISCISTLIGIIIGLISDNESGSTMISIFLGFMFLLMSGLFYPVELMPRTISLIMKIFPTTYEIDLFGKSLVLNQSIQTLSNNIYLLIGYLIVLILINLMLIKRKN